MLTLFQKMLTLIQFQDKEIRMKKACLDNKCAVKGTKKCSAKVVFKLFFRKFIVYRKSFLLAKTRLCV